ncbi:unnamed protein product [Strongylus vulgaris]|uniref:Uncharacterized protein n=1 Tax=Strongylus vulgaris TaxID=40348 RepID=A0A3P7LDY3_STRVU|nr:unnamed protein product [Strongylus vulgaris]
MVLFSPRRKMATIFLLLLCSCVAAFKPIPLDKRIPEFASKLKGKDLVNYINNIQKLFTANVSRLPDSHVMSLNFLQLDQKLPRAEELNYDGEIPERFDAREKWPWCSSIRIIRDQTECGTVST